MTDDTSGIEQVIADGVLTFEPIPAAADPGVDPAGQWRQLLTVDQPSPRHWAMLAAAMRNADRIAALTPAPHAARGGRDWYARAVDLYRTLHRLSGGLPDHTGPRQCVAVPEAVATWLTAPAPHPGNDPGDLAGRVVTVADRLGLTSAAAHRHRPDVSTVVRLLDAAQQAGVFGIPGHRLELHRDRLFPPGGRLVTREIHRHVVDHDGGPGSPRPDLGPARPLTRTRLTDLLPAGTTGVDAAVTLLTRTAALANVALEHRDRTPQGTASPGRHGGRAALGGDRSTRTGLPPDPPPQRPPHYGGRHR